MTDPARRALCYIAVGLCTGKLPRSLYDHEAHRKFTYTGTVDPHGIHLDAVEDHQPIGGEFSSGKWMIELSRSHEHFDLSAVAQSFSVYDHHSHLHYRGLVGSSQITIAPAQSSGTPFTLTYEAAP